MKSAENVLKKANILNNGNLGNTGRKGPNKRSWDILGEENIVTLFKLQLDMALNDTDKEIRRKCTEFLLDRITPKPRTEGSYVKLTLPPMKTIHDIKENEKLIMDNVLAGKVSLEEAEKLFSMTAQCFASYEKTDVIKLIEDIDKRMKAKGL